MMRRVLRRFGRKNLSYKGGGREKFGGDMRIPEFQNKSRWNRKENRGVRVIYIDGSKPC